MLLRILAAGFVFIMIGGVLGWVATVCFLVWFIRGMGG